MSTVWWIFPIWAALCCLLLLSSKSQPILWSNRLSRLISLLVETWRYCYVPARSRSSDVLTCNIVFKRRLANNDTTCKVPFITSCRESCVIFVVCLCCQATWVPPMLARSVLTPEMLHTALSSPARWSQPQVSDHQVIAKGLCLINMYRYYPKN